jgi:hypothetical protein
VTAAIAPSSDADCGERLDGAVARAPVAAASSFEIVAGEAGVTVPIRRPETALPL